MAIVNFPKHTPAAHKELTIQDITYVKCSLKTPQNTRRSVNMDLRVIQSAHNHFNRLVFDLTSRLWEFTANLPNDARDHECYANAQEKYHLITAMFDPKKCWIGKGRWRAKWGTQRTRTAIKPGCVMVLQQINQHYRLWCQIEQAQFELELTAADTKFYPYQGDLILQKNKKSDTWGGWQ